jgi:hypothetical protein
MVYVQKKHYMIETCMPFFDYLPESHPHES